MASVEIFRLLDKENISTGYSFVTNVVIGIHLCVSFNVTLGNIQNTYLQNVRAIGEIPGLRLSL